MSLQPLVYVRRFDHPRELLALLRHLRSDFQMVAAAKVLEKAVLMRWPFLELGQLEEVVILRLLKNWGW